MRNDKSPVFGFHYNKEHDVWECDKCGAWIGGRWRTVMRYHREYMCGKGHGCEP